MARTGFNALRQYHRPPKAAIRRMAADRPKMINANCRRFFCRPALERTTISRSSACSEGPRSVSGFGDFGRIRLMAGANVQDTCVIHGFPDSDTVVEANGHIGHGAVLHGCVVRHDALVGMNAVVMDEAEVGAYSIVAACAFVRAGLKLPEKSLVAGLPAKVMRPLTEDEIRWKREGTETYQDLARRCHSLRGGQKQAGGY